MALLQILLLVIINNVRICNAEMYCIVTIDEVPGSAYNDGSTGSGDIDPNSPYYDQYSGDGITGSGDVDPNSPFYDQNSGDAESPYKDGNSEGANCVFPFIYKKEELNECTSSAVSTAWCATTDNFDRDRKWGYCKIPTYGGTADGGVCKFPFSYNGSQHRVCTSTDDRSYPWCQTGDNKWGYCHMGCPKTGAVAGVSVGVGIIVIGTLAGVTLIIIYRRKQRNVKKPSTVESDPPVYDDVNDKTKQGDTPPPKVDSQAQNDYEDVPMHDTVASHSDYYNMTMVTGVYTGGDSGTDGDNNIYETTSTNIYVNDLGPDSGNVYQQLKKTK